MTMGTAAAPGCTVEVHQNEYLAAGGRDVHAIVTVTAAATIGAAAPENPGRAEIIIADCSGSMAPRREIGAAREAAADDVALRVWTPVHARIRFVKQVAPAAETLTGRRSQAGPQAGDYPVGAWDAGETREYYLCVRVSPGEVGQEMLAARVSLVAGSPPDQQVLGQGLVRASWTEDEERFTRIGRRVAHYTGQAELARLIQEGLEARRRGDRDTATARLGRAIVVAEQSGHQDTVQLLAKVVDIMDAATGTVRLKEEVYDDHDGYLCVYRFDVRTKN